MKEIIIGIDLGTTNSEVAFVKDGQPNVISVGNNKLIPSFVGLSDSNKIIVGEAAKNQYLLYPERTIKSIKRKIGTDEKILLGDKEFLPQEISAFILKYLKTIAEKHLGMKVNKTVITVPAYFSDAQRQATKDAGEIAGFEVMRIINEPTAAALVYESQTEKEKIVLVYDLGGGTFDVSIVQIQRGVVEVLSGHGNNHLGGDDFDEKIANIIIEKFKKENAIDLRENLKSKSRVYRAAESAKIVLSDHSIAKIQEEYIIEKDGIPYNLSIEIEREEYEKLITPYIDETLVATNTALKGANLKTTDIDEILLVGGSTRTPLIKKALKEKFNIIPHNEISPELCVSMGSAIQGAMIAGQNVGTVLVDITPYTFGTSAVGEIDGVHHKKVFCPLIEKNSPIPITKSDTFYKMYDDQEEIEVKVFEGENRDANYNIEIGKFMVTGLSTEPENNEIILNFDLDINGILSVSAVEKITGLKKSIKIDNVLSHFNEDGKEKAKKNVMHLITNDDISEKKQVDEDIEIKEAKVLIEKAERKFEEASIEDKEEMTDLIEEIRIAIDINHKADLSEAVMQLEEILFYLDT